MSAALKIAVCGGSGKMGERILSLALANSQFEVVGAVESAQSPSLGKTLMSGRVMVQSALSQLAPRAEVAIDFSAPEATMARLDEIVPSGLQGFVIGTTGLNAEQIAKVKAAAQKTPIVFAPNMSAGVNALLDIVKLAAAKLSDWDLEIIEAHHNQKKDSPSGTALALAEQAAEVLKRTSQDYVYGREGLTGARKKSEIGIHAVRAGDIVGEHRVLFAAPGEQIELVHRATSRDAFASGALRAALWLRGKAPGLYSMRQVLGA